jgi:TRAP-type C4-dicarboxylate transport system permease small subunit
MRKVIKVILDIIDLYIPTLTFIIMFIAFIIQVVFRYVPVLRPLPWAYDVTAFGFVWTTLLAACHVRRIDRHITFDMFYNARTEKTKTLFRILANGIVGFICVVSFIPTLSYLDFIHSDKSPVLRIPMSLGYGPILVFIVLIGCYSLYDFFIDLHSIVLKRKLNSPLPPLTQEES